MININNNYFLITFHIEMFCGIKLLQMQWYKQQRRLTDFNLTPLLMSLSKLVRPSPEPFLSLFVSTFFNVVPP